MRKLLFLATLVFCLNSQVFTAEAERPVIVQTTNVSIAVPQDNLFVTYRIYNQNGDTVYCCGTGTAYDKRHLLTAAHVAAESPNPPEGKQQLFYIDIFDAEGNLIHSIKGKLKKIDVANDLAIIETSSDLPHYKELDYGTVSVGDAVYNIGCAWSKSPYNVSWGNFVAVHNETLKILSQTSNTVAPGMSGGGVYNVEGKFLGVMVRGAPNTGGLFVPNSIVQKFLEK